MARLSFADANFPEHLETCIFLPYKNLRKYITKQEFANASCLVNTEDFFDPFHMYLKREIIAFMCSHNFSLVSETSVKAEKCIVFAIDYLRAS